MYTGRIENLLGNVRNEILVEETLGELGTVLSSMSDMELKEHVKEMNLSVVFDAVNSEERNQILNACKVLGLCLPYLPASFVSSKYQRAFVRLIRHPVKEVKELGLEQLLRTAQKNVFLSNMAPDEEEEAMLSVVECLCDKETSVGVKAMALITCLGLSGWGMKLICRPKIVNTLMSLTEFEETYKARLNEVVIKISLKSPEELKHLEVMGFFNGIIRTLSSDDILAIMSTLEIILPLATTSFGMEFLIGHKVLSILSGKIVTCDKDPLASVVYPGLAKFFGQIGLKCPVQFLEFCPEVLKTFFINIDNPDVNIYLPSLEAIGLTSRSATGKQFFKGFDKEMEKVMLRCYTAATTLQTDFRVRALDTFANLMHVERLNTEGTDVFLCSKWINESNLKMTEHWYNIIGKNLLQACMDMSKQPFTDIKHSAYNVIKEIATQPWGQTNICKHPGLIDYLMDRTNETLIESKQDKFIIIEIMVNSGTIENTIKDEALLKKLKDFVNLGSNYEPFEMQVAVEGTE